MLAEAVDVTHAEAVMDAATETDAPNEAVSLCDALELTDGVGEPEALSDATGEILDAKDALALDEVDGEPDELGNDVADTDADALDEPEAEESVESVNWGVGVSADAVGVGEASIDAVATTDALAIADIDNEADALELAEGDSKPLCEELAELDAVAHADADSDNEDE